MTNEQAAEILEEVQVIDDGLGQYIPGFDEALDLAITTLRSDLIKKDKAIEALGEEPKILLEDNDYYYGMRDQWDTMLPL